MEQGNTTVQFNCLQLADMQPVTSRLGFLLRRYKQKNLETIEFSFVYETPKKRYNIETAILVSVHKCETFIVRAAVSVFH